MLSKWHGGMRFKDIRLFNLALLRRQLWRLFNNKNTLYFCVMLAKYFPSRDPFDSKQLDKPSYVWSIMFEVTKALAIGFGWQVGNEHNIDIRKHN